MTEAGARSPAGASPPPELVARFKEALERQLWPDQRLGLAVSGGPDSMAMLLLAEAAMPGRFEVATVDHGLRPESAEECAMVAHICAERRIPCEVLKVSVSGGNVSSSAREARYKALMDWADARKIDAIATAHHADDQAETLVMRLNRSSGVAGLSGVRESILDEDHLVSVIRPVLKFRRAELADVVRGAGLTPVNDPSNDDDRFDRARIRKVLADCDWIDVLAWCDSASNLADAEEAIDWAADREWEAQVSATSAEIRYRGVIDVSGRFRPVPTEIEVRIVERAIEHFGGRPRRSEVLRLMERLHLGTAGNLAGVLASVDQGEWLFRPEPSRRLN